jgi:hypothetical protein
MLNNNEIKSVNQSNQISWKLIFTLLIFNNKTLEFSKFVKIGTGVMLWIDILGVVWFIMFIISCIVHI